MTALNSAKIQTMVGETGTGKGGGINIVANETISLSGKNTFLSSFTHGKGNSGNISVTSNSLDIQNEAYISSLTTNAGSSGHLRVDSKNILLTNDHAAKVDNLNTASSTGITTNIIDFEGNGKATGGTGDITVLSQQLTIKNGASLSSFNIGQGDGGNLSVESDNITLTTDIDVGIHTSNISTKGKSSGSTGNLTVTSHNNLIVNNATNIETGNEGTGSSGNLQVNAKNILLSGDSSKQKTGILNNSYPDGTGSVGYLSINSDNLSIKNGATISSIAFGQVDAGDLYINSHNIEIMGNGQKITGLNSQTQSTGNAGNIHIKTDKMILSGKTANILSDSTSTDNVNSGNAGNITVDGFIPYSDLGEIPPTKSELITVKDGAAISTGTLGEGKGGDLTINTTQLDLYNHSRLFASTAGKGNSGKITIEADQFNANNNVRIFAGTTADGKGGDIHIISNTFEMHDDSGILTTTGGTGHGGNVTIITEDFLLNNSRIFSGSEFEDFDSSITPNIAKSGNISITSTGKSILENNSLIVALTLKANAGDISINGNNILKLSGDSKILTLVANGTGNGGNIFISTPIVALNDSFISSRAVEGNGGNISIPGHLFLSPLSVIDASSKRSTPGELNLNPDTNISGSIAVLPESLLNVSEQLNDRCNTRSGKNANSFVVKGKGGIPLSPDKPVSSDFMDFLPMTNSSRNVLKNKSSHQVNNNNYQPSSLSVDCFQSSSADM